MVSLLPNKIPNCEEKNGTMANQLRRSYYNIILIYKWHVNVHVLDAAVVKLPARAAGAAAGRVSKKEAPNDAHYKLGADDANLANILNGKT